MKEVESADQSDEFIIFYVKTFLKKVFPSPTGHFTSFLKKFKIPQFGSNNIKLGVFKKKCNFLFQLTFSNALF